MKREQTEPCPQRECDQHRAFGWMRREQDRACEKNHSRKQPDGKTAKCCHAFNVAPEPPNEQREIEECPRDERGDDTVGGSEQNRSSQNRGRVEIERLARRRDKPERDERDEHCPEEQLSDAIHLQGNREGRDSPVGNHEVVRARRDVQKNQREFDNEETDGDPLAY